MEVQTKYLPIPDYNGFYVISRDGEIISSYKNTPHVMNHITLKTGYKVVSLYKPNGTKRICSVANLVLLTWGPPKPTDKHKVEYIDGDRNNLTFKNLRWKTQSQITSRMINSIKEEKRYRPKRKVFIVFDGMNEASDMLRHGIQYSMNKGKKSRFGFLVYNETGIKKYLNL